MIKHCAVLQECLLLCKLRDRKIEHDGKRKNIHKIKATATACCTNNMLFYIKEIIITAYLLLEIIVIIVVYTRTIEAISAVPNDTRIKYSTAACRKLHELNKNKGRMQSKSNNVTGSTFDFSRRGSIFILKDLAVSFER